jgi:hypothetical protein
LELSDWESDSSGFLDWTFPPEGDEVIWWEGFNSWPEYEWYHDQYEGGNLYFKRFVDEYSDIELFGSARNDLDLDWSDSISRHRVPGFKTYFEGGANHAYFKASIASLAEFPHMLRDAFEEDDLTDSGLYNVRFFIRGKPWTVTVDDFMAFYGVDGDSELMFGSTDGHSIWSALLEKAWAKVKGNYLNAQYDLTSNGIRALTGVPVFDY